MKTDTQRDGQGTIRVQCSDQKESVELVLRHWNRLGYAVVNLEVNGAGDITFHFRKPCLIDIENGQKKPLYA